VVPRPWLCALGINTAAYDEVTEAAAERLVAEGTTLFYTLRNAAEFWNVFTRPRERNGLGLDIAKFVPSLLILATTPLPVAKRV
jgi:hypothetical protein